METKYGASAAKMYRKNTPGRISSGRASEFILAMSYPGHARTIDQVIRWTLYDPTGLVPSGRTADRNCPAGNHAGIAGRFGHPDHRNGCPGSALDLGRLDLAGPGPFRPAVGHPDPGRPGGRLGLGLDPGRLDLDRLGYPVRSGRFAVLQDLAAGRAGSLFAPSKISSIGVLQAPRLQETNWVGIRSRRQGVSKRQSQSFPPLC